MDDCFAVIVERVREFGNDWGIAPLVGDVGIKTTSKIKMAEYWFWQQWGKALGIELAGWGQCTMESDAGTFSR